MFTARYVLHATFCPHSVFMCFMWIWEQTANISLYSIDWLVFITETECVYCAVRSAFYVLPTQCIYVFCVDLRTNSDYFTVQHWLVGFYNRDGECLLRDTFYILRAAHTVYLRVLCGSENKQRLFTYTALTNRCYPCPGKTNSCRAVTRWPNTVYFCTNPRPVPIFLQLRHSKTSSSIVTSKHWWWGALKRGNSGR